MNVVVENTIFGYKLNKTLHFEKKLKQFSKILLCALIVAQFSFMIVNQYSFKIIW